jgi:hypothetical protein
MVKNPIIIRPLTIILLLVAFMGARSLDTRVPVIAVISQPATSFGGVYHNAAERFSEIVSSYVQWVEQTGSLTA